MLIVVFIVIVLAITENGVAIYRNNNGVETLQIFFPYVRKVPRPFVVLVFPQLRVCHRVFITLGSLGVRNDHPHIPFFGVF